MSCSEELLAFLRGLDVPGADAIDEDTPLLESGLLDSLVLFQLALWIEERTGGPLDPATFDVEEEWRTLRSIVGFIEQRQGAAR